jgi:hypothetical protein
MTFMTLLSAWSNVLAAHHRKVALGERLAVRGR